MKAGQLNEEIGLLSGRNPGLSSPGAALALAAAPVARAISARGKAVRAALAPSGCCLRSGQWWASRAARRRSLVTGEGLGLEPCVFGAILENVGDADRGGDPLDPALHQLEVGVVAQAQGVQPFGLGPGHLTGRRRAFRVGVGVVVDEGLPVRVTRSFDESRICSRVNGMVLGLLVARLDQDCCSDGLRWPRRDGRSGPTSRRLLRWLISPDPSWWHIPPRQLRRSEPLGDLVPVHDVPPGLEVVRALVLVLEVVGVLPDVVAQQRRRAVGERVVLVGGAGDLQRCRRRARARPSRSRTGRRRRPRTAP